MKPSPTNSTSTMPKPLSGVMPYLRKSMRKVVFTYIAMFPVLLPAQVSVPPARNPEDVIRYAEEAAADPLSPSAPVQLIAANKYTESDHQTHVIICPSLISHMNQNRSMKAGQLVLQYLVSTSSFAYQHPQLTRRHDDFVTSSTAGIEAAITAYTKLLVADPQSRNKFLDAAVTQQAAGTLSKFVSKYCN